MRPHNRRPRIVVIGSANMDLVVKTERIPEPGETVLGGTFFQLSGGKGANQAVSAARLGGDVTFIGCVGADAFGDQITSSLKDDGIDCRYLRRIEDIATGIALIGVDDQGRNSIIVAPGANARLCFQDIDAAGFAIRNADIVVAQLEIPLDVVDYAFGIARESGVRTILNPAPFRPGDKLPSTLEPDYLVPNEHEATALLNLEPDTVFEPAEVADRLNDEQVMRYAVLTLGHEGSIISNGDERIHVPAIPVSAIDTTAAGDCFIGALAVGLGEGMEISKAVHFATEAAAISVTRFGAHSHRFRGEMRLLNERLSWRILKLKKPVYFRLKLDRFGTRIWADVICCWNCIRRPPVPNTLRGCAEHDMRHLRRYSRLSRPLLSMCSLPSVHAVSVFE